MLLYSAECHRLAQFKRLLISPRQLTMSLERLADGVQMEGDRVTAAPASLRATGLPRKGGTLREVMGSSEYLAEQQTLRWS